MIISPKINKKYITIFAIAVFLSWIAHELAHWVAGSCMGYKMVMTLNSTYPSQGYYSSDLDYQILSAVGPVFTICEAILIFIIMRRRPVILLYPFLFICFYMRLFAAIISIRNPNDEARISSAIGIGKFTLPILVSAFLFLLIYKISKEYKFSIKFNLANLGLAVLFSSIVILIDMYLKIQLL